MCTTSACVMIRNGVLGMELLWWDGLLLCRNFPWESDVLEHGTRTLWWILTVVDSFLISYRFILLLGFIYILRALLEKSSRKIRMTMFTVDIATSMSHDNILLLMSKLSHSLLEIQMLPSPGRKEKQSLIN